MNPALARVLAFLRAHWRPVAILAAVALAFVSGRFSTPDKVVTIVAERTVYKDRVVKEQVKATASEHTKTRIVYRDRSVVTHPDGTVEHRDVVKTDVGSTDGKSTVTANRETTEHASEHEKTATKTVTNDRPQWHASILAGVEPLHLATPQLLGPVALGAHVERRIVGPLWLGAFGVSSGIVGVSVGIEF